jgi:hypothetical protein
MSAEGMVRASELQSREGNHAMLAAWAVHGRKVTSPRRSDSPLVFSAVVPYVSDATLFYFDTLFSFTGYSLSILN